MYITERARYLSSYGDRNMIFLIETILSNQYVFVIIDVPERIILRHRHPPGYLGHEMIAVPYVPN